MFVVGEGVVADTEIPDFRLEFFTVKRIVSKQGAILSQLIEQC